MRNYVYSDIPLAKDTRLLLATMADECVMSRIRFSIPLVFVLVVHEQTRSHGGLEFSSYSLVISFKLGQVFSRLIEQAVKASWA